MLTHLECPGCGSQRALSALLHGNLPTAMHQNSLTVMAIPVLVYRWLLLFRKEGIAGTLFISTWFPRLLLWTVVVFTLLRNIPVKPFSYLAPY